MEIIYIILLVSTWLYMYYIHMYIYYTHVCSRLWRGYSSKRERESREDIEGED